MFKLTCCDFKAAGAALRKSQVFILEYISEVKVNSYTKLTLRRPCTEIT